MARKYNWLKRLSDPDLIQLDAGDLLFSTTPVPEPLAKQARLQAQFLLQAHDLLKHDAAVPGEKDFALGFKTFEELRKQTHVKFLAANLTLRSGKAYLPSHLMIKGVAIIGLVGDQLTWPHELKVTSPIAAARRLVGQLRSKSDFVVALTHEGLEKDEELAKAVPGIDLIIGGHSQSFLQHPEQIGKTWIVQSSFRNQYVGALPLPGAKQPLDIEKYQLVGLDAGYDSPEGSPSPVDQLVKEFKLAVADLNTQDEKRLQASITGAGNGNAGYQTFPKCAECHLKQFEFWRTTAHAGAFEPLVKSGQTANRECLGCHTVGLDKANGFNIVAHLAEVKQGDSTRWLAPDELNEFLKKLHGAKTLDAPLSHSLSTFEKSWTPVQCENCHGPGGEHPFSGTYSKKVDRNLCLGCHTAERAPGWYVKSGAPNWELIDEKKKKVSCPAGEIAPGGP